MLVAILTALFGIFVWPTPWEYHHAGGGSPRVIRVNRITGHATSVRPVNDEVEKLVRELDALDGGINLRNFHGYDLVATAQLLARLVVAAAVLFLLVRWWRRTGACTAPSVEA